MKLFYILFTNETILHYNYSNKNETPPLFNHQARKSDCVNKSTSLLN